MTDHNPSVYTKYERLMGERNALTTDNHALRVELAKRVAERDALAAELAEAKVKIARYDELFRWSNENCRDCAEGRVPRHVQPLPNPSQSETQDERDQRELAYRRRYGEAPPEASVESSWRPIKTALRDGTDIIVGFDFASVWIVHVAWYRDGGFENGVECPDDIGWWSYVRHSVTQEKLEGHYAPTHWMHLPSAPEPDVPHG